jgi:hypothetical protein
MPRLAFMPWCKIDRVYEVDCLRIIPFIRYQPIEDLDEAGQWHVHIVLGSYKTIEGRPVDRAALVRYGSKSLLDELTADETEVVAELVTLACFAGLANRAYFSHVGPYCNSDCFTLYFQEFRDRSDFPSIGTRRREGRTLSAWPADWISITIPVHCQPVRSVVLDETLLRALAQHRANAGDKWGRWQSALTCFNRANSDSDNVSYQMEWILLCGAFERLLEARPDADEVAKKFSSVVVPSAPRLAREAKRQSDRLRDSSQPVRYEWMREFYRIRGDFAHGKLATQQPAVWKPPEHLVLATIAFPLAVKCLLQQAGVYRLTDEDRAQIESFEAFADTPEFASDWSRLVEQARWRLACRAAEDELRAKGLWRNAESGGAAEGEAPGGQGA